MAINANAFVLCIQCFFPIQNEGKNPQIAELFANVWGKKSHFEKKVPNFGEKDRFFKNVSLFFAVY